LDHLDLRERTLVLVAASTGLRQSELFVLKWSDIDLSQGTMNVTRSIAYGIVGRCETEASQKPSRPFNPCRGTAQWRDRCRYREPDDWVFSGILPQFHLSAVEEIDRWFGIEISFDPELNECFRVKNVKKGAEPVEGLRDALKKKLDSEVKTAQADQRDLSSGVTRGASRDYSVHRYRRHDHRTDHAGGWFRSPTMRHHSIGSVGQDVRLLLSHHVALYGTKAASIARSPNVRRNAHEVLIRHSR
jgi:integrase